MAEKIYLANPYGFSLQQRELLVPIQQELEKLGLEVLEPFSRNNQVDVSKPGWAYEVARRDSMDVFHADAIFAVVNGTPPDEGVMVELGMAMAWQKRIYLFRDDFRRCTDSEDYPLNLMLFASLPRDTWREYYYTSVADISNPSKALYKTYGK